MKEASKRQAAAECDPEMIRRDLHDGLCQNLTASLFFAESLRARLRKDGPKDAHLLNLADKVVEAASAAASEMRAVLERLGNENMPEDEAGPRRRVK